MWRVFYRVAGGGGNFPPPGRGSGSVKSHVVLRSPLSPAEAEEALRAAISDPPPLWMGILPPPYPDLLAKRGTKWFVGTARDGRIRVRVRVQFLVASGGGFRPWFRGRLVPDGEGSRLEGRFCIAPSTLILTAPLWLGLLWIFVGGMGMLAGGGEEIPGGRWVGLGLVGTSLGFALWARFVVFVGSQADDGEETLRRFLALHLRVTPGGPEEGRPLRSPRENPEAPS